MRSRNIGYQPTLHTQGKAYEVEDNSTSHCNKIAFHRKDSNISLEPLPTSPIMLINNK